VNSSLLIDLSQLRIGMYVQLDVGWMHHPFPVSSFRIVSADQIATLRGLGLAEVRYFPHKSDPEVREPKPVVEEVSDTTAESVENVVVQTVAADAHSIQNRTQLQFQNRILANCNQRFADATRQYRVLERAVTVEPEQARNQGEALVSDCLKELLENGDSVIRLLSEGVGDGSALHPVNVMVVSLLLGKALGMKGAELHELGMAALLHDLGKLGMSVAVFTPVERQRYESHVGRSVAFAQQMGLSDAVLTAIAQHHEMADGSGFPLHLLGEDMGRPGQILALVNHYDRMCNPVGGIEAFTPHEALSVIFAQLKSRFDPVVLGAFIRMMGVYPPGSVVQLVNDRYAIVVSVNSTRPLRPKVIVHDPRVPKDEALVLDLETMPELGIRRSLKPAQLPRNALDYLSPRKRICYFFERAVDPGPDEAQA
jgi:HD-GYP domain-containing protein (c-di-GMP phosphodiesterase class II)